MHILTGHQMLKSLKTVSEIGVKSDPAFWGLWKNRLYNHYVLRYLRVFSARVRLANTYQELQELLFSFLARLPRKPPSRPHCL